MNDSGMAVARALGSDCLESEANVLLHSAGFQIEEPEETEPEIDSKTMLVILNHKLRAIQNGEEHGKVKRAEVIFAAITFYSVIETRELVTVYETWESAFRRAQRKADSETIMELNSMIEETQAYIDADSALDAVYESEPEETQEEIDQIRAMFAVNSIRA